MLTTVEFAERLKGLAALGVEVEVLDEPALEELGMGALLGVGKGSATPSKVVVMQWKGGAEGAAPLALVGKGVVFDTGGVSIKPAAGMEDMKGDMAGAATVTGFRITSYNVCYTKLLRSARCGAARSVPRHAGASGGARHRGRSQKECRSMTDDPVVKKHRDLEQIAMVALEVGKRNNFV